MDLVDRLKIQPAASQFLRTGDIVQLIAEREEAAERIERLQQTLRERELQPMHTAPLCSVILGVVDEEVRLIRWGKTSHIHIFGWCLADQGAEDFDICHPTHWMPLPEPPISAPIDSRHRPSGPDAA